MSPKPSSPDVTLSAPMLGHSPAPLTKAGSGSSERGWATSPGPRAAGHADPVVPPHIHAEPPGAGDVIGRSGHEQDSSGRERERVEGPLVRLWPRLVGSGALRGHRHRERDADQAGGLVPELVGTVRHRALAGR